MAQELLDAERGFAVEDAAIAASVPRMVDFAETFLGDCAGRWKPSTLATNQRVVRKLLVPAFGSRRLDRIARDDVIRWMNDPAIATGSKNRALPVLSSLFEHAELKGVVPSETNPCRGLRRKRTQFEADYLSEEDFAVLGRVLREHAAEHPQAVAAIRFMALTGCRKSEALGLTWSMIDGNRAALPDAKSGPKAIWIGKVTRRAMPRKREAGYVFEASGQALVSADLNTVWTEVRSALSRPRLRLHDLRHSFASVAISMGHDLVVVGGLLDHKDKGSTAGYVHLASKDVTKASHRVGRHLGRILKTADDGDRKRRRNDRPTKPRSIFSEYIASKERLDAFCAARSLDPRRFQEELSDWQASRPRRKTS